MFSPFNVRCNIRPNGHFGRVDFQRVRNGDVLSLAVFYFSFGIGRGFAFGASIRRALLERMADTIERQIELILDFILRSRRLMPATLRHLKKRAHGNAQSRADQR